MNLTGTLIPLILFFIFHLYIQYSYDNGLECNTMKLVIFFLTHLLKHNGKNWGKTFLYTLALLNIPFGNASAAICFIHFAGHKQRRSITFQALISTHNPFWPHNSVWNGLSNPSASRETHSMPTASTNKLVEHRLIIARVLHTKELGIK